MDFRQSLEVGARVTSMQITFEMNMLQFGSSAAFLRQPYKKDDIPDYEFELQLHCTG